MSVSNLQKLLEEKLMTLTEAAKITPSRPHVSTLTRWTKKGVRGVRLASLLCGGKRMTSREEIVRFLLATTAAADGGNVVVNNLPSEVSNDIEEKLGHLRL